MHEQIDQELLLSIDWLGLSLRLNDEVRPIPGHVWKEYSATNVWAKRRVLWSEHGDRVCTLLSEPRSKILSSTAALLEIENEWLYHGIGVDGILQLLLRSFFFEILGISRLDLAIDFNPTVVQCGVMEQLWREECYIAGKRNGSGFWSTNSSINLAEQWRNRRIKHQLSWGHKTSAIRWKLYYKTKELWDAGAGKFMEKPYIVDQWRMHDLQINNVWRLEVSLKHLNDYKLYGQIIDLNTLRTSLVSLMADLYNERFSVRLDEGHKDKTNDKKIDFLPMPRLESTFAKREPQSMAEHNGRITLLRHLVSSLDDEHILLDEPSRMDVFSHIDSIVKRDGLGMYFHAITGKWVDEWISDIDTEARLLFEKNYTDTGRLQRPEKGKYKGQELYDVPRGNDKFKMVENAIYDIDGTDSNVVQRRVDKLVEEMRDAQRSQEKGQDGQLSIDLG